MLISSTKMQARHSGSGCGSNFGLHAALSTIFRPLDAHLYMLPRRVPPEPARSKLARTGLGPVTALGCLPMYFAASLMASFTSAFWPDSDFKCRLSRHAGSSSTPAQVS